MSEKAYCVYCQREKVDDGLKLCPICSSKLREKHTYCLNCHNQIKPIWDNLESEYKCPYCENYIDNYKE